MVTRQNPSRTGWDRITNMQIRLAVLFFLLKECIPQIRARLLLIYFYGDARIDADCPQSEQEWLPSLQGMIDWLGVDKGSEIISAGTLSFLASKS